MVKVIPWVTICSNCDVRLEYENEDVQSEEHEYTLDGVHINKDIYIYHFIVCPNCGHKIYV